MTLTELLRAHPDQTPRTPCAATLGGVPIVVSAVLQRTAIVHPPGDERPDARYLVALDLVEIPDDVELRDRVSHAVWQRDQGRKRGRAHSARGRRKGAA